MNGMKQIFSKELARIFKDRKMIFSVFILPVIIMLVIMNIMSSMIGNMENDIESHIPIVYMQNAPESFLTFLAASGAGYDFRGITAKEERADVEKSLKDGRADLLIEFPESFDTIVAGYKPGDLPPQVKTFYNPSEDYSRTAYNEISQGFLEQYRQTLLSERVEDLQGLTVFTVDLDNPDMVIQDEDKATGKMLGMMLPYFITILLFAGAMGIGTDMIAGEKERGTMASLLVSPIKRSSIVLGKVFSLMTISGISSVVYMAAMVVFMPQMMTTMTGSTDTDINMSLAPDQIIKLGILLIAIAFLYATIIVLISVFAKTVKEASSYIMPAYMLVLVLGLLTMFNTGETKAAYYFVPIYNASLTLQGILTQETSLLQYAETLGITLALGAVLIGVIVKAFESEKVMSI